MKQNRERGNSDVIGVLVLAFIILIMVSTPRNPSSGSSGSLFSIADGISPIKNSQIESAPKTDSAFSTSISLGSGNASYSYQPYEEYITLDNQGRASLNITGWQLRNGKDKREYYQGGLLQRFSADVALIPQGAALLSPIGSSLKGDIVLNSGERAIITTGNPTVNSPYPITSFKENMCTGYIEALPDYSFTPALNQNCPRPYLEPGVERLDTQCRDFIQTLSSCKTPVFTAKTPDGGACDTCINGKILSSSCAAFIKEHFSYQGCMANHSSDPNFSGRTWRVFLGRGWEMWNKDYETIELYDRLGQLAGFQNY
jgi:hypothetical protein